MQLQYASGVCSCYMAAACPELHKYQLHSNLAVINVLQCFCISAVLAPKSLYFD